MSAPRKLSLAPVLAAFLACAPAGLVLSSAPALAATASWSVDQLAPVVAPVALYPDPLLAQVFTAAQFPEQVAEASRWLRSNPRLQGDAAIRQAARKRWNASIRSLVAFPDVLHSMAGQPAWLRTLGQAYARQPAQVMAAAQRLRKQAYQAGNLKTGKQQRVVVEHQLISIEPVTPTMVYVPAYDPGVVYGHWAYGSAPVVIAPRPRIGEAITAGLAFGLGVAIVNSRWGDIDWDDGKTVVNNYYSDNSVYVEDRSTTIDNSDRSSHVVDNSDHSSYVEDNSDHSSHVEDNSDHSSHAEDNSDRSSHSEDNSDRSSHEDASNTAIDDDRDEDAGSSDMEHDSGDEGRSDDEDFGGGDDSDEADAGSDDSFEEDSGGDDGAGFSDDGGDDE